MPVCANCGSNDFVWASRIRSGLTGIGTVSLRGRGQAEIGTRICRNCGHADLFVRDLQLVRSPHLWRPGEFVPMTPDAAKAAANPGPAQRTPPVVPVTRPASTLPKDPAPPPSVLASPPPPPPPPPPHPPPVLLPPPPPTEPRSAPAGPPDPAPAPAVELREEVPDRPDPIAPSELPTGPNPERSVAPSAVDEPAPSPTVPPNRAARGRKPPPRSKPTRRRAGSSSSESDPSDDPA